MHRPDRFSSCARSAYGGSLDQSKFLQDAPVLIVIILQPLYGLRVPDGLEHPEIAVKIKLEFRLHKDLVERASPESDLLGRESVRYEHSVGIGGDHIQALLTQRG